MIDVTFLLLVFFLVATRFERAEGVLSSGKSHCTRTGKGNAMPRPTANWFAWAADFCFVAIALTPLVGIGSLNARKQHVFVESGRPLALTGSATDDMRQVDGALVLSGAAPDYQAKERAGEIAAGIAGNLRCLDLDSGETLWQIDRARGRGRG